MYSFRSKSRLKTFHCLLMPFSMRTPLPLASTATLSPTYWDNLCRSVGWIGLVPLLILGGMNFSMKIRSDLNIPRIKKKKK